MKNVFTRVILLCLLVFIALPFVEQAEVGGFLFTPFFGIHSNCDEHYMHVNSHQQRRSPVAAQRCINPHRLPDHHHDGYPYIFYSATN